MKEQYDIQRAERYMENLQQQLESEQTQRLATQNQLSNFANANNLTDQNLVQYQLELKEELDQLYHLLSGHVIETNLEGNEIWVEPRDDRLKIFSDYGVKQIMNIIQWYINRNTLLSYYDQPTIMWKIRDFGIELADLIYNRYEVFFHYPSPEELFEKYSVIMKNEGMEITEKELYSKCVEWSQEELKSKLKHYPMIVLSIIDSVHSTFQRAVRGEERRSLRQFMHVNQTANQNQEQFTQPTKSFSLFKSKQ